MTALFEPIDAPPGWAFTQGHDFARIFPMLEGDALDGLTKSINENGWMDGEYITLYEGLVLDGRNRLTAAVFGPVTVLPKFRQFTGTPEQALNWVVSTNLHRRHLTVGQKAVVALEFEKRISPILREKQKLGKSEDGSAGGRGKKKNLVGNSPQGFSEADEPEDIGPKSREIAATQVGIAPESVSAAKFIENEAPDLIGDLQSGKISLHRAEKAAKERVADAAEEASPDIKQQVLTLIAEGKSSSTVAQELGLTKGQVSGIRERARKQAEGPIPGMGGPPEILNLGGAYRCHSNDDLIDRRAHQAQSPTITVTRDVVFGARDLADHYTREEMKSLLIQLSRLVYRGDLQMFADIFAEEAQRARAAA